VSRRARRRLREEERERRIVSRPDTSRRKADSSAVSVLLRKVPSMRFMKDSGGAEECLRSRARNRDLLSVRSSLVASTPTCLRLMSVSVTFRTFTPKDCQRELTAAKPARVAMREMPIMPIVSRLPSLKLCLCTSRPWVGCGPNAACPIHQNPASHPAKPTMSKNTDSRNVLRLRPSSFHPAADVMEWISSAGVTTINEMRRIERVILRAAVLAAGFRMLEISQKISSARTVDNAIVVANVKAAARSRVNLTHDLATDEKFVDSLFEAYSELSFTRPLPDRIGNSFRQAKTVTTMKVKIKGSEENARADRRLRRR